MTCSFINKNALHFLLFSFAALAVGSKCPDEVKRIDISIRVHVIFAGYTPFFMRSTTFQMHSFESHLRRAASSSDARNRSILVESRAGCPAVLYTHNYSASILPPELSLKLDKELQKALSEAPNRTRLPVEDLAEKFRARVVDRSLDEQSYSVLIYTPGIAPSSSEYGYASPGSDLGVGVGVSQAHRFIFVDGAARPNAFARSDPAPGELLLTVSRDSIAYARELHNFVLDTLLPLPHQPSLLSSDPISLTVHLADANDALIDERLVSMDSFSQSQRPSFDLNEFSRLVDSVARRAKMKFYPSIDYAKGEMSLVSRLPMLLARALRSKENDNLTLDPDDVIDDLRAALRSADVSSSDQRSALHTASKQHVAIFVLSFSDARRNVQFIDGSRVIADGLSPALIVVLDNRAQSPSSASLLAASKAIQILYAISTPVLSLPGTSSNSFSQLIADIAARNHARQHISEQVEPALRKAVAALYYEGFDKVAVSHLNVDSVRKVQKVVRRKTRQLLKAVKEFLSSRDSSVLKSIASDLRMATASLSEHMVEIVCSKTVTDDFMRDVAAAKNHNFLFLLCASFAVIGFLYGFSLNSRSKLELPLQALSKSVSETPMGNWFSTLGTSKSKRN